MPKFNALGAIIPDADGTVSAPPGQYWNTPNSLAEIPQPAVGAAAGNTAAAYAKAALGGLSGLFGGGGSSSGLYGTGTPSGLPGSPGSAGYPGTVPSVQPVDTSAATSAAFGRAKDTAGQTARAELDSLRGVLGETGQLGGGAESRSARQIVEDAAGQVGNVTREQAIQQAQQAQQNAITNYQGGITQRGQDIQQQEAAAQLALAQQNANWQHQMSLLQSALGGLQGLF